MIILLNTYFMEAWQRLILRPWIRGGPKINLCHWNLKLCNFKPYVAIFVIMHPPPQNPPLLCMALNIDYRAHLNLVAVNVLIRQLLTLQLRQLLTNELFSCISDSMDVVCNLQIHYNAAINIKISRQFHHLLLVLWEVLGNIKKDNLFTRLPGIEEEF